MKIRLGDLRRLIIEALDPNACPNCMGSKKAYVGFSGKDEGKLCTTCGGSGKKPNVAKNDPHDPGTEADETFARLARKHGLTQAWKLVGNGDVDQSVLLGPDHKQIVLFWDPRDKMYREIDGEAIHPDYLDSFVGRWIENNVKK